MSFVRLIVCVVIRHTLLQDDDEYVFSIVEFADVPALPCPALPCPALPCRPWSNFTTHTIEIVEFDVLDIFGP